MAWLIHRHLEAIALPASGGLRDILPVRSAILPDTVLLFEPTPFAVCLMGPTACGKTRAAVELVQNYPCEIISVDSAMIYRGLNIGSGKPDEATLARAPHRLINIRDPAEPYSAAEFRTDAIREIREVLAKGRIPLLVGGTMLYFKVLRDGLASMPAAVPEVRQRILMLAETEGWQAVHARLQQVDPAAAQRIHPNDPQRLQRALEVFEITGKSLTALHSEKPSEGLNELPCELKFVAMLPESRADLHRVIAERFHAMLERGLVDEVANLRARGDLHTDLPALRSVGYRQVWEYLAGQVDHTTMVERGIAATRQLAKRQLTWLRSWPDLATVQCKLGFEDANNMKNYLNSLMASPFSGG
jgi:tRNA dimethylallyltransferase